MPPTPRPHLQHLTPYEWEASTEEVARLAGLPPSRVVRFDTNTSPWPPVAWERTVLDVPRLPANEYPHPSNEPLRSALARHHGVQAEQVVVTCGADEALYLIANAYLEPGRSALGIDPSFSMFAVVTGTFGAHLERLPVDGTWDVPAAGLLDALRDGAFAVAWLCSPNNPTGRLIAPAHVSEACSIAPDTLIVLDEAYSEISGMTVLPLVAQHSNLVVIRTFSKGYGLAGARVGYAISQVAVAAVLDAVRPPQNISVFGITAAVRALEDQVGLRERVQQLVEERQLLSDALRNRGWEIVTSEANFVLGRPGQPAHALGRWLQQGGMVVRSYGTHPRLMEWLRITVRSPEENSRLLQRIDAFSARDSQPRHIRG